VDEEFWAFLSEQLEAGIIKSSVIVYNELTQGSDYLSQWFKSRRKNGLAERPNKMVQQCMSVIAQHVVKKYGSRLAAPFLNGGDAWIIAHAMATGGVVVTQESERSKGSKVKVPTVCKELNVPCIDTYRMIRDLGFKRGKKP
jgi:hypothetical protein